MHILFLTTIHLTKKRNGGEVASRCFIDALRQLGHTVTVLGYLRKGDLLNSHTEDLIIVDERHTETRRSKQSILVWYALGLLKGLPYSSAKYHSRAYVQLIEQQLCTTRYNLVIIDHAQLGWLLQHIPPTYPIITIAHNIETQIYLERSENSTNPLFYWVYQREAKLIGQIEQQLVYSTQQIWTLTENDARHFASLSGNNKSKVFGISPLSELPSFDSYTKAFDIGLIGSWDWTANDEALRWFVKAIHPLLPLEVSIRVAGKGADWLIDQYENLHYEGVVPDAQAFLAQAKVIAIPTLRGGGIQIKTLDAIASGSAVVATPSALRGIYNPPSTITQADNAEAFAKALIKSIQSPPSEAVQNAKAWYRNRQQKFSEDVQSAISELNIVK